MLQKNENAWPADANKTTMAKSQEAAALTFEKLLDGKIVAKAVFITWHQQNEKNTQGKPMEAFFSRRIFP